MSVWNICIQTHALGVVQCTCNILTMYAQYFFDMVERFLKMFMNDFFHFWRFLLRMPLPSQPSSRSIQRKESDAELREVPLMVQQGIILGHVISKKGIEMDKSKVDLIAHLPPPKSVKDIRSFLGHAGFYRRFIQNFSKIAH